MAGSHTRRNPALIRKDELAGGVPTKGSNTSTPFSAQTPTPTQAPAPSPGPPGMYTNIDLQKATRLTLELFVKGQKYGKADSAPWNRALKAWNPDLYYGSFHMKCYYFCQQFEDHFDTADATEPQHVLFVASFFRNRINFCWQ